MRRMFSALAVVALLGVAAAQAAPPTDKPEAAPKETAQAAPAAKAPDITPETANALGAMCEFLKAQPVMAFRAEVSQEQVYPKGQTVQVNRVLDVVLRRPDKLYARVTGDGRDRLFVYDGKTATRAIWQGVYAVLDAPATVDALLTMMGQVRDRAPLSISCTPIPAPACSMTSRSATRWATIWPPASPAGTCSSPRRTRIGSCGSKTARSPFPASSSSTTRKKWAGPSMRPPSCVSTSIRVFRPGFLPTPRARICVASTSCLWARPRLGK